jgi:hypothetical protein
MVGETARVLPEDPARPGPAEGDAATGGRLIESSRRWQPGGRRESITASELRALEGHGFTVFHNVRWPGKRLAKIDHVVIGGGQVWVISAQKWSGSLTVTGGVLKENGRLRQKYVTEAAEQTQAIASLSPMLPPSTFHPILCVEKDEWVNERFGDVWICSSINVATVLQTPPDKGPDYLHNDLVRQLEEALKEQVAPPPPVPLRRVPPPELTGEAGAAESGAAEGAKVSRRARRRYLKDTTKTAPSGPGSSSGPRKGVVVLAVAALAVAALAYFKPSVVTEPVGSITDSVTGVFWPDDGGDAPADVEKPKKNKNKGKKSQQDQQQEQPAG